MNIVGRIKSQFGLFPTPIRPGHVYVDQITGEAIEVTSVQRTVPIVRQDAERIKETTVRKQRFRDALDAGLLVHDEDRCPECRGGQ